MFIGEYRHSLDVKGRIIVPAKFRDGLGDKFVLTKGLDGCLFAYSKDEWTNFENKTKELPLTNKDARAFVRFFFQPVFRENYEEKRGHGKFHAF